MPFSRLLGHSTSTVSRELARDRDVAVLGYHASGAAAPYRICYQRCARWRNVAFDSPLYQYADDHLNYWRASPQRITFRLRGAHSGDTDQCICHETIYAPKAISLGKAAFNRSRVGMLVERKTRYVVLCRMDGCTAKDALEGFTRQMRRLPAFLRQSVTYDSGRGMTCLVELAKRLNFDIWFADSHAPTQRGSNENTNGLLRKFLQRPGPVACHADQFNDIAKLFNGRPRPDARLGHP